MGDEKNLQLRNVLTDISGHFVIKSYQRGYRWKTENVRRLLFDILQHDEDKTYCLQPIVIKDNHIDGSYELIDGQQRLTTLYILLCFLSKKKQEVNIKFTLEYEIRKDSEQFLSDISRLNWDNSQELAILEEKAKDNIDFHYMMNTAKTIATWFDEQKKHRNNDFLVDDFVDRLRKHEPKRRYESPSLGTCVIWYNAGNEDSKTLFRNLNDGKISLSNAELVKALFLKDDAETEEGAEKTRLAREWDEISYALLDEDFWAFITNKPKGDYSTPIDFLLELYGQINGYSIDKEGDKYALFFWFSSLLENVDNDVTVKQIWEGIRLIYLKLHSWYRNNVLFNKIGYLVCCEEKDKETTLAHLLEFSMSNTKDKLSEEINRMISQSINIPGGRSYRDLSYIDNGRSKETRDTILLNRILLIFNVLSMEHGENSADRFNFKDYKKESWTLEHIHAQHSNLPNKQEDQIDWIRRMHNDLEDMLKEQSHDFKDEKLVNDMANLLEGKSITTDEFRDIYNRVFSDFTSKDTDNELIHHIGNLALLSDKINSSISNYIFDTKRRIIIDHEKKGRFIPICTRNVFLKYYSESSNINLHFWTIEDQKSYRATIEEKLQKYTKGVNGWTME